MKNKKLLKAYTLVELLAVIGILSVITTIVVSVIFISLTGSKKTETLEVIRQNGDLTLSQMIKSIRFAKSLDVPANCNPSVRVSSVTVTPITDDSQITYSCMGDTIASNGASLLPSSVKTQSCSFVCSQNTISEAPTLTIRFTLVPSAGGVFAETKAQLPFQSSVTLRNYSR